ncbi:MAG: hypothetical protein EHM23_14465 [Acidobacteria bacterium]|nr:MAG: hypothetical protein EHM23_14465 [Acidobacteriota bacterium]
MFGFGMDSSLVQRLKLGGLACLIIAVCGSQANAGVNRWSSIGPEGTTVEVLAASPVDVNLVYIAMGTQLYRSTDRGGHWVKVGQGVAGVISSLAADRVTADVVYAGTSSGAYKSSDRGATWISIKHGLAENWVFLIVTDRQNNLYLVNGKDPNSAAQLYKSANGGATWELISADPGPQYTGFKENLVTDPKNENILYRSKGSLIFKSTNGGRQWVHLASGETGKPGGILAVDPLSSNIIYGEGYGLFRSDDGGSTWVNLDAHPVGPHINVLAIDPVNPSTLYTGTDGQGLYKSTDNGQSWLPLTKAFAGPTAVQALAVSPADPTVLFCGIRDLGFFESHDKGANWTPRNMGLPAIRRISALTGVATGGFFAATNYGPYLRQVDGSWLSFAAGLDCTEIYGCSDFREMVVDPTNPLRVYAATGDGVYTSLNGGQSWAKAGVLPSWVTTLVIDPVHSQVLYAGTSHDSLFKSINGAATWDYCANGLGDSGIASLLVDPTEPSVLYCGSSGPMYKSTNGGASWTSLFYSPYQSNDSPQGVYQMALDPFDSNVIFAAGHDISGRGRVYRTTDAGTTWESVYVTSFQDSPGSAIAIDPVSPTTVYAATFQGGVIKSEDRGETWFPMNTGLDSLLVTSLLVDPKNHAVLYVGTDGKGVFEYRSDPAGPAELTLTSPNGDEYWAIGSTVTIRWTTAGSSPAISRVAIDYSPDDGVTFSELVASVPNSGAYTLVLPGILWGVDPAARFRIRDAEGASWDVSDRPFRLFGCICRLSQPGRSFGPAGGLADVMATVQSVCSWTREGDSPWIQVLSGPPGPGSDVIQYSVSPNTGAAARSETFTIARRPYTISQSACEQTIALTQPPSPTAQLNVSYSWTINAVCGTGPYSFALASGGLPPGLKLLPSGAIEGVPTVSGAFSFTVKATDSLGGSATQSYTLRVSRAPRRGPRSSPGARIQ